MMPKPVASALIWYRALLRSVACDHSIHHACFVRSIETDGKISCRLCRGTVWRRSSAENLSRDQDITDWLSLPWNRF